MSIRPLGFLAVLALLTAAAPSFAATAPPLWNGLPPGTDAVGYRRIAGPTVVVDVWYPAAAGGVAMRFVDCLEDSAHTASFLTGAGVPASEVATLLGSPLTAHRSAPASSTARSPLVLVAQGNGESASDQVVLCEFLASHGYVVASTPSPMLRTPLEREDQVGAFAETQCSDLAAAIAVVAQALPVDTTRIAAVGHSFGARAALLLGMRNPRARALVSLDGGIGTATALESFEAAPSFRAGAPLPPILHDYETLDPFMKPDFTLLKGLHARSLTLREMPGMHHVHFTTWGFAVASVPGLAAATHATPSTARGARTVAEGTLAFLEHCVPAK